jgi:hypothetical protein
MSEHAPRAERANGTGRSRRVTTTSDFSARGLRAAVLDERASRHAIRRRASEEGSGSQRKPRERSEPNKNCASSSKQRAARM